MEELEAPKSTSLFLESLLVFVVKNITVRTKLGATESSEILSKGLAKRLRHSSGEDILVPRFPELLASELALLIGQNLAIRIRTNDGDAADWLVKVTDRLPLGDLIGAQAIVDAAQSMSGFPLSFLGVLIEQRPTREKVRPGLRAAMQLPEIGDVELSFNADGSFTAVSSGRPPQRIEIDENDGDGMEMYGDFGSWLILSHLASMNLAVLDRNGGQLVSATPTILMEVGTSQIPLRRPASNQLAQGYFTHDLGKDGTSVCHISGIVEPITMSLMGAIAAGAVDEEWFREAISRNSYPFLARLDIALSTLSRLDEENAQWAQRMHETLVRPALKEFIAPH